ncbi:MAG: hypothetical protein HY301_09995 [Verrucomicrobia bacterium]|nr:hypothetical protein [Verrucomicrobiota bacterium]
MSEDNSLVEMPQVEIPDELWFCLLRMRRCPAGGFSTSFRLFSGKILERLIVSDRGYILGRMATGLGGAQGDIDSSMLTFGSEDIEALEVPAFHFWQRPNWILLNPDHPARRQSRSHRRN